MCKILVAVTSLLGLALADTAPAFAFTDYSPAETSSSVNDAGDTSMPAYNAQAQLG
jgi:hypothetical protein